MPKPYRFRYSRPCTVVHVPSFFEELNGLQEQGLDTQDQIYISNRTHVVLDLHQQDDGLEEAELAGGGLMMIGTTGKGIDKPASAWIETRY